MADWIPDKPEQQPSWAPDLSTDPSKRIFGQEKKKGGATRQEVMGIATPRQRKEAETIRKGVDTRKIARTGMQGIGATAGGILGAGAGPVGAAAGGALGYGIGNKLADIIYGDRPAAPVNVSGSPFANQLAGTMLQTGGDIATGAAYEAGGALMGAAGRGIGNLADLRRGISAAGGIRPVVENALAKRAERTAAEKILAARTTSPAALEQIQQNALANQQVEQGLPGFRFNTAQRGGDPNLLSMARQVGQQPGVGTALSNESIMAQNQALRENIASQIRGKGNPDEWLQSLQNEQRRLEQETLAATRASETEANRLQGADAQAAGGALLERATQARRASSAKGKALFEAVPKDLPVETAPLYDKIKELFGSFNSLTQRLSATPTSAMGRMQKALEPEEEGAAQLFDYEGVMTQLGRETGLKKGKTGKGFYTESDFQSHLKRFYPSVAGKPKSEVMDALKDGINGRKLTPFRQKILEDMAYDLESQGAPLARPPKAEPTGPEPLPFKDMQDFRSQVKAGARQAYAAGDYELGWKYDQLANATSESFEQTAAQAERGSAIPRITAEDAKAALPQVEADLNRMSLDDPMRPAREIQYQQYQDIIAGRAKYEDFQAPESNAQRDALNKLKEATKYWREVHVPSFRQGATGKILRTTATGEQRVVDSSVGGEYFKSGRGAAEGFDSFARTFGQDPGARQLIKDYAAQDLLKSARNPVTGEIESKRVASWLHQHSEAVEKFGMKDDFGSLTKALARADRAKGAEATFNKSAVAKALEVDPDKAVAQALMTGTGRKQSIARLKHLVEIAKRDTSGAAVEGLRAAVGDYFERETTVTARDLAQNRLESIAKVDKFMKEFMPALQQSGIYSTKQLAAFENVHKALVGIAKQQTPHPGFGNSPTFELMSRLAASGTSMAFGHIGLYGAAKGVFNLLERPIRSQIDEAVARAMFDPRYAEAIANLAGNLKAKMPVNKAEKIFTQRMLMLGAMSTGKAAGEAVSPSGNNLEEQMRELGPDETEQLRQKEFGGENE